MEIEPHTAIAAHDTVKSGIHRLGGAVVIMQISGVLAHYVLCVDAAQRKCTETGQDIMNDAAVLIQYRMSRQLAGQHDFKPMCTGGFFKLD